MKFLINCLVAVFTAANILCHAHVIRHPVLEVPQDYPTEYLGISSSQPQIFYAIPRHSLKATSSQQSPDLLQALRSQEESLKTQIKQLRYFDRVPGGASAGDIELLEVLLAQLEIIKKQITYLLAVQQIEQQVHNGIPVTGTKDPDLPKETSTNKIPEGTTEKPWDTLATLTAQRDLINSQIESYMKTQNLQVLGAPYRNYGDESTPPDWLSSLIQQRDLLNLQLNHILSIPGFENTLNAQLSILGTPNRKPTSPTHNVQNPISSSEGVQHGLNSDNVANTIPVTVENRPKSHNEHEQPIAEKPLDIISVLTAQRELIDVQINQLIAVRQAQKKMNEQTYQPDLFLNDPTGTQSGNKMGTSKDDSTELLMTLIAQRETLNTQIEYFKTHSDAEFPNIPPFIDYNTSQKPFDLGQDNVPELLAALITERESIDAELKKLLPVWRPRYGPGKYDHLQSQKNLLNIQIEHLLKFRGRQAGHSKQYINHISRKDRATLDDHFSYSTPSEVTVEEEIFTDDPLRALQGQADLINVQLDYIKAIEEAEEKLRQDMYNMGSEAHHTPKFNSSGIVTALNAQKAFIETLIDKIIAKRGQLSELDFRLNVIEPRHGPNNEEKPPVGITAGISSALEEITTKATPDVLDSLIAQRNMLNREIEVLLPFRKEAERNPEKYKEVHELLLLNTLEAQRDLISLQIEQFLANKREKQGVSDVTQNYDATTV